MATMATTSNPLSPRSPSTRSPPWSQIVRGAESDPPGAPSSPSSVVVAAADGDRNSFPAVENQPESSDNGGGNAGNKKPAWNKTPLNGGGVESVPVVMGADSWPALSESTKASPRLSSSDSSKNLPDLGSVALTLQVTGVASPSTLSLSSPLHSPSKLSVTPRTTSNANHNPTPNHGRPARQKSMKRDGGNNAQANGGFSHQPLAPGEVAHSHNNSSSIKPSSGGGSESSGRDMQNPRESGVRNAGGDHPQPRNSFRRGNGGPHSRGDGSHQNYGGRRGDQDRGNHDWNHQRSFNGRDAPMQPGVVPRGYVRPQPGPFPHPVSMRPLMHPMVMPDMPILYYPPPPGMPFGAPVAAPMYFPASDPQLLAKIVNQIDYYFSNENLVKDTYLRQNMDEHGWVRVALIANFKKVMQLTDNIQLIMEAIRGSSVVEAQGDKIRKRDDWMRWVMPTSVHFPTASGSQSPKMPNVDTVSAQIRSVALNDKTIDLNHPKGQVDDAATLLRSSSGNLNSPSQTTKNVASSTGC